MHLGTVESRQPALFESDQQKAARVLQQLPHYTNGEADALILAYTVTHVLDLLVGSTNYDLAEMRRLVIERAIHSLRQDGYTV